MISVSLFWVSDVNIEIFLHTMNVISVRLYIVVLVVLSFTHLILTNIGFFQDIVCTLGSQQGDIYS